MKLNEYLQNYFIFVEQDYEVIEDINIYKKEKENDSNYPNFSLVLPKEIEERFIDKEDIKEVLLEILGKTSIEYTAICDKLFTDRIFGMIIKEDASLKPNSIRLLDMNKGEGVDLSNGVITKIKSHTENDMLVIDSLEQTEQPIYDKESARKANEQIMKCYSIEPSIGFIEPICDEKTVPIKNIHYPFSSSIFSLIENKIREKSMSEAAFFEGILTFIKNQGIEIENSGIIFEVKDGIKTLVIPANVMRNVGQLMTIQYKK